MMKKPLKKKVKKPVKKKLFKVEMKFNGNTFKKETDDIGKAIRSFKPLFLKTKVYFKVEKGNKVYEKVIFVPKARMIFRNDTILNMFVRTLTFK